MISRTRDSASPAEDLAIAAGKLRPEDDYAKLAEPGMRDFFRGFTIQVGSTGNLGLSIGISGADPTSYFVDDEKSKDLFLCYAAAARRLPEAAWQTYLAKHLPH